MSKIEYFAWILPSECLGSHIFTRAGGFAYKYTDETAKFFPVVGKAGSVEEPYRFEPSCHLEDFWKAGPEATTAAKKENKYVCTPAAMMVSGCGESPAAHKKKPPGLSTGTESGVREMEFGEGQLAAVGMEALLLHGLGRSERWNAVEGAYEEFDDADFLFQFSKFLRDNDPQCTGQCVLKEIENALDPKMLDPKTDPDQCRQKEEDLKVAPYSLLSSPLLESSPLLSSPLLNSTLLDPTRPYTTLGVAPRTLQNGAYLSLL